MKILVLGSAFNPPHNGHADTIRQQAVNYDTVILVPSFSHGFGKKMKPFVHRVHLTEIFAEQFEKEFPNKVIVSDIEKDIYSDHAVYTYHLLKALQEQYGEKASISFLMGPDNEENFHKFYNYEEIHKNWKTVIAEERIDIRSSTIRPLITKDKRNYHEVSGMLGKSVCDKIFENIDLWVE